MDTPQPAGPPDPAEPAAPPTPADPQAPAGPGRPTELGGLTEPGGLGGPGEPGGGDPVRAGDQDPFRELRRVARAASDDLADAVGPFLDRRPAGNPEPPPYPDLVWQLAKALGFAAPDPVPDDETFEATADAADDAADDAAAAARRLQAGGRSPQAATALAEERAILWMDDVGSISRLELAYAPADADQTLRTLGVRITVEPGQPLVEVLGADRGAAPVARPATAADVLEVAAAMGRIAAVVARLTAEPAADGLPVPAAGTAGATVVCQLCGRTVPAAAGRRALYAGEGDVDAGGTPQ